MKTIKLYMSEDYTPDITELNLLSEQLHELMRKNCFLSGWDLDELYSGGKQTYKDDGNSALESLYCGGKFKISFWISEKDLYKALKKYGFINIQKNEELCVLNHVNGPCLSIFASKN